MKCIVWYDYLSKIIAGKDILSLVPLEILSLPSNTLMQLFLTHAGAVLEALFHNSLSFTIMAAFRMDAKHDLSCSH